MESVKKIFDELQVTSGKIDKESIIRANQDNQTFKDTLYFLLNPFITTGISAKKISKQVPKTRTHFKDGFAVMKYLQENNTGTDMVIANVQGFINQQTDDMKDFYKALFTKSLRLGCAANTVNKVLGKGFIPQFEVMLAENFIDHINMIEGRDFSVTLKLDGIRAVAVKDGGSVKIFSRQGQPIEGLVDIETELLGHYLQDVVLDGELLIANTNGITSKEQYKETTKIVRRDGEKRGIKFRVFDYLSLSEFTNQKSKKAYVERRTALERDFAHMEYIEVLPVLYSGNDISKIYEILDKVRAESQEGCMVNIIDAPYEFKRTKNLLKVKVMQDCDLRIVGFEEGQGRLSGTLGRLNVDYKGNILGVGSGFSDKQRKWFWDNQDKLVGRVITVQYFEETKDRNGKPSLRFPVYKELREIDKEVNY